MHFYTVNHTDMFVILNSELKKSSCASEFPGGGAGRNRHLPVLPSPHGVAIPREGNKTRQGTLRYEPQTEQSLPVWVAEAPMGAVGSLITVGDPLRN